MAEKSRRLILFLPLFLIVLLCSGWRDWNAIKQSGVLNVLSLKEDHPQLSRRISPRAYEKALIALFAEQNKLKIRHIYCGSYPDLFVLLDKGAGDVIASNITSTPGRAENFGLTLPFHFVTEELVVPAKSNVKNLAEAFRTTGAILAGTSFLNTVEKLKKSYPQIRTVTIPRGTEPEELLSQIGNGKYGFTILDDNFVDAYLAYNDDIRVLHRFPEQRHLVWAVGKANTELKTRLDEFIKSQVRHSKYRSLKDDLPEIRKRKYIRILTRNTEFCYFLHRGIQMGFEYELVKRFADQEGLALFIIIPPEWKDMEKWLVEGKGDLVASTLTLTPERAVNQKLVRYCGEHAGAVQLIAGRVSEAPMKSVQDLKGRTLYVRPSSSYWSTLAALKKTTGVDFHLKAIPENMEMRTILKNVASGKFDLTACDDVYIGQARSYGVDTKPLLRLTARQPYVWVVRADNPELQKAVNAFFKRENRSAFFNIQYKKYFDFRKPNRPAQELFSEKKQAISPYDPLFRKYGKQYFFNWCLLAAQSYQESGFNPHARSHLGTEGLMQLLPSTARELGFDDVITPDKGIHAGTEYLARQRKRISGRVSDLDKLCFALASYNAGYGHLLDARKLAAELGYSPDIWKDNVAKAFELLSTPKYAARAKYGYCRSEETLAYVKNIMIRYENYRLHVDMLTQEKQQEQAKRRERKPE